MLLQLAYSWCHDKALAEDLVQDAIEKAFKNINRIKHSKALKAWFIQIMLNCWRDILRKKQELQNIDDLIFSDSSDIDENPALYESVTPEQSLSTQQTRMAVKQAISHLPMKYRTVLTLVDIYGASYTEVAEIIDAPLGTVMSRICRARQELLKSLSSDELNPRDVSPSDVNLSKVNPRKVNPRKEKQTVVSIRNNSVFRGEE